MFFSFLSLAFYTLFGLFFKLSSHKKCNPAAMNMNTLLFASMAAFVFFLFNLNQYHGKAMLLALCGGSFLFAAFLFTLLALKDGKISTCWTIMNLGMVIPVIFSIFLWKELVDPKKITGLSLICFAIIMIGADS